MPACPSEWRVAVDISQCAVRTSGQQKFDGLARRKGGSPMKRCFATRRRVAAKIATRDAWYGPGVWVSTVIEKQFYERSSVPFRRRQRMMQRGFAGGIASTIGVCSSTEQEAHALKLIHVSETRE